MRLYDTSHYCETEEIENFLVEVLPVNLSTWVTFKVKQGFNLALNSSNLRYNKVKSTSELIDLPDGIYEFKMSVKPNILNIHHFYHLRTTLMKVSIQKKFNDLISDKCNIDKKDYHKNREALRNIDEYLSAAKWMIEECGDKKKGIELYEFAKSLLKEYDNECGC